MIEIKNISAGYLAETVLSDFSFSAKKGELTGIFGPNGSGKTTLLCAINGLARVSAGTVSVGGVEFNRASASAIRKKIGYAPQYFEIDSKAPVSAGEVIMMGTYGRKGILRPPGAPEKDYLKNLSKKLGLERLLHKPFGRLSGGEKQKALIARALIQEPEILLLDEIFAWVDAEMQGEILGLIKKLHEENNLTILIVSHNALFVKKILTRVVYLEKAKIVFDGPAEDFKMPLCCTN